MNKADLVEELSNQTGLTKRTCREAVDALISAITDCLAREEKATLVGFGTFQVRERKVRRGKNPRTGEEIQIRARKVARFRPGKSLRAKVEQK